MNLRARIHAIARATRPRSEIETDVNDEFAHHLEQLQTEVSRPSGQRTTGDEDGTVLAAARFGDADALRRQCVNIQLEDRTMLMKLNAILTAALLLAAGALGWIVIRNTTEQTRAMNTLAQRVGASPISRTVTLPRQPSSQSDAAKTGFVYISGNVNRAGVYGMEKAGMTLDRLLVAAGGAKPDAKKVTVKRGEGAKQITVAETPLAELASTACTTVLAPDDLVTVE